MATHRAKQPAQPDPIEEARRQWVAHGWADAADGMAMVTSLTRVQQLINERIDAVLRPLDLTFARYEVLRLLAFTRAGSMPMTRLGSLLQVHPTTVSSAVARLEGQGLVSRERDGVDRRIIRATLTPRGREVVEAATVGLNGEVFEVPGLDHAEVEQLTRLLRAFRLRAGDVEPGTDG
jgi:DNA-binding MarR family transcriptional regulator